MLCQFDGKGSWVNVWARFSAEEQTLALYGADIAKGFGGSAFTKGKKLSTAAVARVAAAANADKPKKKAKKGAKGKHKGRDNADFAVIGPPKSARRGHTHSLRLDLPGKDSRSHGKFILDPGSRDGKEWWLRELVSAGKPSATEAADEGEQPGTSADGEEEG